MGNTAFDIPSVEQVQAYMQEKKPDWPPAFCEYYAKKFWHSYNAKGWQIANNKRMKSWESAFHSQWQDVKYEDDVKVLHAAKHLGALEKQQKKQIATFGSAVSEIPEDRTIEYLDTLLSQYMRHPTSLTALRLSSCYDFLKTNKLIRISKAQKESALLASERDGLEAGKAVIVKIVFDSMAMNMATFTELLGVKS